MPNIPQLMTTAEVAEQCGGVSVKTVIRWSNPAPHARAETARLRGAACSIPLRGRTVQVRTRGGPADHTQASSAYFVASRSCPSSSPAHSFHPPRQLIPRRDLTSPGRGERPHNRRAEPAIACREARRGPHQFGTANEEPAPSPPSHKAVAPTVPHPPPSQHIRGPATPARTPGHGVTRISSGVGPEFFGLRFVPELVLTNSIEEVSA